MHKINKSKGVGHRVRDFFASAFRRMITNHFLNFFIIVCRQCNGTVTATWKELHCKTTRQLTLNYFIHIFARINGGISYPFEDMTCLRSWLHKDKWKNLVSSWRCRIERNFHIPFLSSRRQRHNQLQILFLCISFFMYLSLMYIYKRCIKCAI
jgi:hypothetical protein